MPKLKFCTVSNFGTRFPLPIHAVRFDVKVWHVQQELFALCHLDDHRSCDQLVAGGVACQRRPVVTVELKTHSFPDFVGTGPVPRLPFTVVPNLRDDDYANSDMGNAVSIITRTESSRTSVGQSACWWMDSGQKVKTLTSLMCSSRRSKTESSCSTYATW